MKMSKTYNPQEFEKRLYKMWSDNGYFTAKVDKDKKPFSIVIPPPNITGQLHMGHALNNTIQDVIIRFKRMQGYSTLWLPGTDHASIATEVKIVDQMKSEGLDKEDVGRDGFLEKAWEWKDKFGGRIVEQLKRLGSSCDWSRERFTMDAKCNKAVRKVFVDLYNKGLIYQGNRIINWCPSCLTALSDAEVEYEEQDSFLWHFKYPLKDGSGFVTVATTRPETIPGDTAVAVNPEDERYKDIIGKTLILPLVDREIPVVADDYVSKEFGTGVVKITPAHDPNDFEVGKRHNLDVIRVMDDSGTMNKLSGKYVGQDRMVARANIVKDLEDLGLLVKVEPYKHNVGGCYRCRATVEPIVSKQWFVDMQPLAKPAIDVVRNKEVKFIPERFSKIYFNWMENIKDWCISRQLWWGHRIPAYYCQDCDNTMVQMDAPAKCSKCGSTHIKQDEDVLDTWFSSALWPFSTLGYPDNTEELEYFYPTNVLVTAYDIIFFWVARMIFSGIEHMDEIPFPEVLIHGIVRDSQGRKMSKSLGNGIDPLEIIDQFGADTLRFSLATGIAPGGDTRYSPEKVESCRNFVNKIWNASRFVLMNLEDDLMDINEFEHTPADKWILGRLNSVIDEITRNLEKYEIGQAASKIYDFTWNEFCDWYIELVKPALYSGDKTSKTKALSMLVYVLKDILKLLHPFVPFVTEEIYQNLPKSCESIMISKYPTVNEKLATKEDVDNFEGIMEIIKAVRNVRVEMNVAPSKPINMQLVLNCDKKIIEDSEVYLTKLANITNIEYVEDKSTIDPKAVSKVTSLAEMFIPLGDLVDVSKEIERLQGELKSNDKEIARCEKMLSNPRFVDKAPEKVVNAEKEKLVKYKEKKEKLEERINALK